MNSLMVLADLLARMGSTRKAKILITEQELNSWPVETSRALKAQKLLTRAKPAQSATCPGCEDDCTMPVHSLPGASGEQASSFIVCDKRSDINRVSVSPALLQRWGCAPSSVCNFIANTLQLRRSQHKAPHPGQWEVGMGSGKKRNQMLGIKAGREMALYAGDNSIPLADAVLFQDGRYTLDRDMIQRLIDSATTTDPRYTPNRVKQEARKMDTKARHERWQKKYRELKRLNPDKTGRWYAQQIIKMGLGEGRTIGTIIRKMKE